MSVVDAFKIFSFAFVVIGMAWVGASNKKIVMLLVWASVATFVSALIFSIHRLWPTDYVSAKFSAGNMNPYLVWNVTYFFIDFIPIIITVGILTLSAGITAWFVSVRLNRPKWMGIMSGIIAAIVLLIPAFFAGIIVLTSIIPGSWP